MQTRPGPNASSRRSAPNFVVTRAPFRVSFAGGGTDLPSFYHKDYGAVLSTAIDKHVYVMIKRRNLLFGRGIDDPFQYRIRLSYASTENVHSPQEIKHPIVREALTLLEMDEPMDIATMADVPAGTGLGSSGTFRWRCSTPFTCSEATKLLRASWPKKRPT